jgi:hypothetical protein
MKFNNETCNKIEKLLGNNFVLDSKSPEEKIIVFEFVNRSKILNKDKNKYIKDKIMLLETSGFFEIQDCRIRGTGRYLKILIKSVEDYENDKLILLQQYEKKIEAIDRKISRLNFM